jgi:hypothetical protein
MVRFDKASTDVSETRLKVESARLARVSSLPLYCFYKILISLDAFM